MSKKSAMKCADNSSWIIRPKYLIALFCFVCLIQMAFADVLLNDCSSYTAGTDNERYYLNADITDCDEGLWLNAGYLNQEIDCQGHKVIAITNLNFIEDYGDTNLKIHNCHFINNYSSGSDVYALYITGSGTVYFYDNIVSGVARNAVGISTDTGSGTINIYNNLFDMSSTAGEDAVIFLGDWSGTLNITNNNFIGDNNVSFSNNGMISNYYGDAPSALYIYNNNFTDYGYVFSFEISSFNLSQFSSIGNYYGNFPCTDGNSDGFCDSPFIESFHYSVYDYFPLANPAPYVEPEYVPPSGFVFNYTAEDLPSIAIDGIGKFMVTIVSFVVLIALGTLLTFMVKKIK